MTPPPAEATIDIALVRALLEEQHADLADGWLDGHTWTRGRAWALALGVAHLANAGANDRLASVAAATIDRAIVG